jgi:hypothetical protein
MSDKNLLDFIEKIGSCQFTKEEAETILERKMTKEEVKIYKKGILLAEFEVREVILKMSKQGSTPAITQFLEMVKSREKTEN